MVQGWPTLAARGWRNWFARRLGMMSDEASVADEVGTQRLQLSQSSVRLGLFDRRAAAVRRMVRRWVGLLGAKSRGFRGFGLRRKPVRVRRRLRVL